MGIKLQAATAVPWLLSLAILVLLSQVALATEKKGRFLGAVETEYPEWFKDSFLELEADVQEATQADRRVMLFFHQDGCPYCNLMVERNLAQKDIYESVREHLDVIALNMWGDREVASIDGKAYTEKTYAAALRVQFTPTLIFLDEQGRSVLRVDGYYPPEHFKVALDYVVGRKEKESTFRDYYASVTPKPSSGELNPQDFFTSPPHVLTRDASSKSPPLAVFFEQTKCPNCDAMHRKTFTDPPTRELIDQFENVQLDMWSDTPLITPQGKRTTAMEWARELGVTYAPTIVFFDGKGQEVIRTDSYFNIFHTQSAMEYVLSGSYRDEPSFQRYISARAEAIREKGIDVDLLR